MSSLHVGSLDVHADVEEDHVDRDSDPGSEDSDVNVDSNSEIKFCLSMMSMEKALQSAKAKVEAGSGNWKWTNLTCKEGSFQLSCASCHQKSFYSPSAMLFTSSSVLVELLQRCTSRTVQYMSSFIIEICVFTFQLWVLDFRV